MKVYYRHVDYTQERSFAYYDKLFKQFNAPFHMHPEFEIAWIADGSGKLFVGNHISNYSPNDVLLIGSNVPHCWHSNTLEKKAKKKRMIILHFRMDFMGADFFYKPEMKKILTLLEKSKNGLLFNRGVNEVIELLIQIGREADRFEQMMIVFRILRLLSKKRTVEILNKHSLSESITYFDYERIGKVYSYISDNLKENIRLEDVADIINISPKSFCRYFKKITQKTLMATVIEHRIDYACNLLKHSNKSVIDICFESGFRNVSHFNNCFRNLKQINPLKYRKHFEEQEQPGIEERLKMYRMD